MKLTVASLAFVIAICGLAVAQEPSPPPEGPAALQAGPPIGGDQVFIRNPKVFFRAEFPGKWWKDSALMKKLGVTDEQVQKIEKIFQNHRLELIDLHAALEKQEVILEPMVEADQPDEAQVIAQIDKVAQARASLEKSNARMLLAIRRILTLDQWKKLRDMPGFNTFHAGPEVKVYGPGPSAPLPPAMPPPGE